jgi:hypothetical protein
MEEDTKSELVQLILSHGLENVLFHLFGSILVVKREKRKSPHKILTQKFNERISPKE